MQKPALNPQTLVQSRLQETYDDEYYPDFLVDKCKEIFLNVCARIESEQPENLDRLYEITHQATEQINDLQEAFEENDSEIETVARDCLGTAMYEIAEAYGFAHADIEELIAPRDW